MKNSMQIVKSLEDSGLIDKRCQNRGSLAMLLGTFVASLLENVSWGKGIIRASEGTIRARPDF